MLVDVDVAVVVASLVVEVEVVGGVVEVVVGRDVVEEVWVVVVGFIVVVVMRSTSQNCPEKPEKFDI